MPYTPPAESGIQHSEVIPTRARFLVLTVLCLLSGILYLDRICIGAALTSIREDLKISHTQTAYYTMAFTLAYGLFEIPTGRWGDRLGARRVLTRISLWWSAFTALTGACTGLWMLVSVRFLFGAGEAGAFPNVARVMARWFPDHERGRAQGILLAASLIGAAVAPKLAAELIQIIGWRWTFVAFGSLGAFWAAGFYLWFRDDPADHSAVNALEAEHIGRGASAVNVHSAIPWKRVFANPSIWFLSSIMACASFNSYIYFTWYQEYLKSGRSVGESNAGTITSMVLAFAALGTFAGGFLLDLVATHGSIVRKRMLGGCSFFLASALLGCGMMAESPWVMASFAALSCFATQTTQSLWWSCAIGISGKHVGALFGLMNSVGVFGAMSSQYLVGAMADSLEKLGYSGRDQWDPIFYINMGVLIVAGLLWSAFVFKTVESDEVNHADR